MGWNTTIVVMNDALHDIERDPDFGKKLAAACAKAIHGDLVDVTAMGHCNAATVIETHHADTTSIVAVGGNYGTKLYHTFGWSHHTPEGQERLLRDFADKLGFRVVKKPTR